MPKNKRNRKKGDFADNVIYSISDNQPDWRTAMQEKIGEIGENSENSPPKNFARKKPRKNNDKQQGKSPEKQNDNRRDPRSHVGSEPGERGRLPDSLGLRVIGGKFRGSKIEYAGDNRVRPMKDRVREAVFNLVGPEIKGCYVIDLFGGTGAVTIEALSRGAVAATVVELHLPTAALLRKNLESLDLLKICTLRKTDAFFWAKNREEHPKNSPPWVVFCCPPYDFYVKRQEEMLEMLQNLIASAPPHSVFVVEADERFDFDLLPILPPKNRIRSYPPAEIAIFTTP